MKDLSCFLAAMINLFGPLTLLILWHRKTGARFYPAIVAFITCIPVFFIGNAIRSGFSHSAPILYYIQQGILFGIFEEGAKFLVLRYFLTSYDRRTDAVSYGIGHGSYECLGCGISCIGLIGSGRAAPDILFFQLWSFAEGAVLVIALTVLIFYGIQNNRYKVTLPAAILIHAVSNASVGIFIEPVAILLHTLLTAAASYAAYRCWQAMQSPFEE